MAASSNNSSTVVSEKISARRRHSTFCRVVNRAPGGDSPGGVGTIGIGSATVLFLLEPALGGARARNSGPAVFSNRVRHAVSEDRVSAAEESRQRLTDVFFFSQNSYSGCDQGNHPTLQIARKDIVEVFGGARDPQAVY